MSQTLFTGPAKHTSCIFWLSRHSIDCTLQNMLLIFYIKILCKNCSGLAWHPHSPFFRAIICAEVWKIAYLFLGFPLVGQMRCRQVSGRGFLEKSTDVMEVMMQEVSSLPLSIHLECWCDARHCASHLVTKKQPAWK